MFSWCSKGRRHIWENAFSVQFVSAPGPRINGVQCLFPKFLICEMVLHMFVESTIAMRRKIRFYELNWRNCSIIKWQAHLFCALKNILYAEASHANFHFDWWKLQNYKAEKKYFPTYRPLVLTDRHKIINFNNRKNEIKFERISWILPVSELFRIIDLW